MNSKRTTYWKLFLIPLFTMLFGMVTGGCSDDKEELQGSQYGYVQFKLYKSASYAKGGTTRAGDLNKLGEAQKVEIEMLYNGASITQTLILNAYNESNAEYGMRSDKLQLLVGDYKVVGYKLLDKLDEVITSISASSDETFTVVSRGLTVKDLTVDVQSRGTVTFKLTKTGLPETRATGDASYLFKDIKLIDVTVTNTFTRESTTFKKLKVAYKEEYKEHENPDNPNDKYMDIGVATSDSAVWLPTGNYRVTAYTTYRKSGAVETALETQKVTTGEPFAIEDNRLTKHANVPILLSETKEYIKDYIALKEIWEALNGKEWGYYGSGEVSGANWNFNKEMDMWGDQPGVTLNSNGRVVGLTFEGFGAAGRVPDAIGQLTELKLLALGSHSEKLGRNMFDQTNWSANMSETQRTNLRMHYRNTFLDYDVREGLSEMIQKSINDDATQKPIRKSNRISLKDVQTGKYTNQITFVSKAVMRLKQLQLFYIGNAPIKAEDICTDWENPASEYAKAYEKENLTWKSMTELTDIEIYNCAQLDRFPDFLFALPEMQLLNVASNTGISGEQLKNDWSKLALSPVGKKLQILYLSYNNLKSFPTDGSLRNMKKMGMLDCYSNEIETLAPFGKEVKLATLTLAYNKIQEIPEEFCGFTNDVETLDFSHNELKYIPNIFDASSVHVMGSVDLSYNQIGSVGGKNVENPETFKGINASTISLAYNSISKFPSDLFRTGSPISTINLSNNRMTEIPEYSLKGKNGNYKNTYLLTTIDLRFNKLKSLSDDFRATTLPYLSNMDVSYNCFSKFPTEPLNSSQLKAFGIRHQRDADGNRILREWPEGISTCPSLLQLQIGANDIRKVNETINPRLWVLEIKDNPNISLDVTHLCPYIKAGMYMLIYDKTQDIRGCDTLKQ